MLKIYHAPQSRSMRVVWLAEEIGCPYEIQSIEMFSAAMKEPAFLAVHPLGKVPAIDDDGFVLWETTAILTYLDGTYGQQALVPPGSTTRGARIAQWMGFGEDPLTINMGQIAAHEGRLPEEMRIPALADRGRDLAPGLVGVVERVVANQDFIAGDAFSGADIMVGYGLMIAAYLGFVTDETPHCKAYSDRITSRAAYQKALSV